MARYELKGKTVVMTGASRGHRERGRDRVREEGGRGWCSRAATGKRWGGRWEEVEALVEKALELTGAGY